MDENLRLIGLRLFCFGLFDIVADMFTCHEARVLMYGIVMIMFDLFEP